MGQNGKTGFPALARSGSGIPDFWWHQRHTWDRVFEKWIFINKASDYWYYSFFLEICTIFIFQRWKLLSLSFSKICHLYHVFSSFPLQASLSFMLLPLLSKKWLIFAKSYYYRSMRYPMYALHLYLPLVPSVLLVPFSF